MPAGTIGNVIFILLLKYKKIYAVSCCYSGNGAFVIDSKPIFRSVLQCKLVLLISLSGVPQILLFVIHIVVSFAKAISKFYSQTSPFQKSPVVIEICSSRILKVFWLCKV
jgi:hypothetical protein